MKHFLLRILGDYLTEFPEEEERQAALIHYLSAHTDSEMTDWNNFEGHLVAGGFIYAKNENKFLVLYHKDLKYYLYPEVI